MALHFKHEVLYCEYVNENFMGLDRHCLIEKFLCMHVRTPMCVCANIDICSYPKLSKEPIAQERPCCSQRETPDSKNASYQYSLMFTMKWISSFIWKCQLRNTAMWTGLGRLRTWNLPVALPDCFSSGLAVREKHTELTNAQRCACVCVYTYTDMAFWDSIVQAANMFSVTNAKYFKRNCEFNVLFFESGLDRFWGTLIKLFLKILKFQSCPYFLAWCSFW